jgi:hypothetical protein
LPVADQLGVPKIGCCGAAYLCADQHFYPTSQSVRRIQHGGSAACEIADCADLVIVPMSFLDAPAEQGCRLARSAQSERPHPRPYGNEVRNRESRCEETHGRPEGEPHRRQRFTPPIAEDRVAARKSCAGNGAEAQECSQAAEQDCADVASRNLPLRHTCRVKVGTIRSGPCNMCALLRKATVMRRAP